MSIPFVCRTATTQHAAARLRVAASAAAVTVARASSVAAEQVAAEQEASAASVPLPAS